MTKREALILTLAGSLATAGVGRYAEHYARAERLVDEVLTEHAHELAEVQRAELDIMNDGPYLDDREWMERASVLPNLIDPVDPRCRGCGNPKDVGTHGLNQGYGGCV